MPLNPSAPNGDATQPNRKPITDAKTVTKPALDHKPSFSTTTTAPRKVPSETAAVDRWPFSPSSHFRWTWTARAEVVEVDNGFLHFWILNDGYLAQLSTISDDL
ncbi:hypothetical protein MSAN_00589000 [Mycena sanguinolenta]|uniref:Uncharacterized protein n=1 Tax=Mycena sanguinolenta TaxID=230812 RepID=A0A8H6Z742_9AGAR|nr:hypothetical protein MSAN_00589000 [Mycena sanguinolenta]